MTFTKHAVIEEISDLFGNYGEQFYGEKCNQRCHAISSAYYAREQGYAENIVVAALLHDIGHFIAHERGYPNCAELGYPEHAILAADWLSERGFPEEITEPIRYHVMAKRYRATTSHVTLSAASEQTLALQGGRLTVAEAQSFAAHPYFEAAILLRECDDSGKPAEQIDEDIESWLDVVAAVIGE